MRIKRACQVAVMTAALAVGGFSGAATAYAGDASTTKYAISADDPVDEFSPVTDEDIADPSLEDSGDDAQGVDGKVPNADTALKWFSSRKGSKAYQGYCERAVRLAWARKTHHASAKAHWNSTKDGKQYKTGTPPKGAFVFWNIGGGYGHVGLADGKGGFWATSVGGKIGHASSVRYFKKYLGWKYGNSN